MTKKGHLWRTAILALLMLTVFFLLVPAAVANAESDKAYDTSYDYIIKSYHVDVVAHADNTYDIVETIEVRFNIYQHGIYRYIPMYYNGKLTPVTNIDTFEETTKIRNKGTNKYIRLGDTNQTIIGDKTYTIAYTLNMGEDENDGLDAIYLNIIGTEWYTKIYEVTFDIDVSELAGIEMEPSVSVGYEGSTGSDGTEVEKSGQHIYGGTTRTLKPYEGLTLYVAMPEGTFASAKNVFEIRYIFTYGLSILTFVLLIFWFMKYGSKREPVPVVTFYPPEGMNPAELGYVIDESVDNEDIGALFIHWASKGLLSIQEGRFNKFTLTKTGEMGEGYAKYEIGAFNALWALGNGMMVKSEELKNRYYMHVTNISRGVKRPFESGRKRLYQKKAKNAADGIMLIAALCFGMIALVGIPKLPGEVSNFTVTMCVFMACFVPYLMICMSFTNIYKMRNRREKWKTNLLFAVDLLVYFGFMFLAIQFLSGVFALMELILMLFSPLVVILLRPSIKQYTDYGFDLLQQVLGYRKFIATAEKSRIEMMMAEDPNYAYTMLPYAMVLGVSDIWARKFNVLMTAPPSWYSPSGSSTFSADSLMNSMTRTTSAISRAASSSPASSGGGGGGGSSGGGGGGGGGGSW